MSQPASNEPIVPVDPPPTGTIDITGVVSSLRDSFVTWAVNYIYGVEVAIPGMEWVALPIISNIDRFIIEEIVKALANSVIMEAFFLNTAVRKASQAADYVDAINAKNNLPTTATSEEYENAENVEMAAFRNFVMVTN